MGRETGPQGGTGFRLRRAQFWTLAQSKYISEGAQKWTLVGSKVVPPGGPVFGPFILSDVLKFCRLLCAQNGKREATYTNSIRGRTLELGRPEFASPIFLVFEGPKIDPSKRPPLGRRSWHGWQRGTQCHQNTMSGREDRKRFYNTFCISSNLSNCCYLIQVSSPHPLLYSCKLPKGECALFYGGFLGFPLQSVGFPRGFPGVSQGFPRGFPGVSVVSSTVASGFEAQSKERAKFLRGVNVHCSKGGSEGFLYKVLGFPGVPWVSCTAASVFEPESKERVGFLRGFPRVSQRFPWVSEVSSTFRKVAN